jgi:hypothetical protein
MDWFANRYINWKCYCGKATLDERVKAFMQDPIHKTLVARKVHEGATYNTEVAELDNPTVEVVAPGYRSW